VALEPARTWRVTVSNYLAAGGDGFSTLKEGRQRIGGGQDIDALVAYLASTLPPNPPYDPGRPPYGEPRLVRQP
jgi:5'-nucleotidase